MGKNILVLSDLHCGSVVGLTPPEWWTGEYYDEQVALWQEYIRMLTDFKARFGNPDVCVVNGDALDGKSSRWGATDVITTSIRTQIKMAAECLYRTDAKTFVLTRGTPYHVGAEEDWEDFLADEVGAHVKDHAFVEINGVNISIKHKVAASSIPHGAHTPVARERLWDVLWSIDKAQHPMSDIIIRSHTHRFTFCGDDSFLGITTPALQGLGSKYGARLCSGTVDFGICYIVNIENGKYEWGRDIALVEEQQDSVIVL